jgi:hypothetical protein
MVNLILFRQFSIDPSLADKYGLYDGGSFFEPVKMLPSEESDDTETGTVVSSLHLLQKYLGL